MTITVLIHCRIINTNEEAAILDGLFFSDRIYVFFHKDRWVTLLGKGPHCAPDIGEPGLKGLGEWLWQPWSCGQ